MTKEELLKQEQEEMDKIRADLNAAGMDPEEIARYLGNLKEKSEFEKTGPLNLDDINFAYDGAKQPLELDEADMALSMKTDNIASKKKKKLQEGGKTPQQLLKEKIRTDDVLNDRSVVTKRPKMQAKVKTGMHDKESIRLGSVDEESLTSEAAASKDAAYFSAGVD